MPATAARIGFITEPFRRAVATTTAAETRHGNFARETDDPIETWFADVDDAQTRADARQALLSVDRRMFEVTISGRDVSGLLSLLASTSIPTGRYIDEERGVDMPVMATEFIVDIEAQSATFKVWG